MKLMDIVHRPCSWTSLTSLIYWQCVLGRSATFCLWCVIFLALQMLIGWDIFLIIFQRMIHNVTEETTPAQCLSDSARLLCTQPKHFHPDCSWPTLERSSELKRLSLFMGEADAAEKYHLSSNVSSLFSETNASSCGCLDFVCLIFIICRSVLPSLFRLLSTSVSHHDGLRALRAASQ